LAIIALLRDRKARTDRAHGYAESSTAPGDQGLW
jgi:hypothetical protein